jgi:hypothetical protein
MSTIDIDGALRNVDLNERASNSFIQGNGQ